MKNLLKNDKAKIKLIICIVFFIAIMSISNNSMWFDETCRVFAPMLGDLSKTVKTSLGFAQPGYMLFMYLWERITFGTSIEFFIRCSNLLFVPVSLYYTYKIVKAKKWNLFTILLFFIHPMFVYYMNEATPYMIVYSLALAYTYYVFFTNNFNSRENIVKINIIYLFGVFVHFMFGFIIILYITKCILENYKNKNILLEHLKILLLFCIAYIPLLLIYLFKLVHVTTGFGFKNIAYVLYGFLGMAGLGLSRNDLRAFNFGNITMLQIISLILISISCLGILYFVMKKIKNIFKKDKLYIICLISFFAVIFVISFVIGFGLWERHCFVAFPLFMVVLIDIFSLIKTNYKFSGVVITIYIIMLLVSSVNIRFNYYYQCDDFKGIYNYVENNVLHNKSIKDSLIIVNFENSIYNLQKINDTRIIKVSKMNDKEIINYFVSNSDAILILFEKDSSEYLYNYFDDNYKINRGFNSFKIIERV